MLPNATCVSLPSSLGAEPSAPAPAPPLEGRGRRRPRLLLVEPDEAWGGVLAQGPRAGGFEVRQVGGAPQALRLLGEGELPPQLVIAEAALEGTDGFTLCGQLRGEARTAQLPVLLLSRCQEEFHRDLAGGVGADDWLPRPVEVADVVALARLWAGRRALASSCQADTGRLPLAQVVRALLSGARSGRLELPECSGGLVFRHGAVVDAAFGPWLGASALRRLLCFGSGVYTVSFGPRPQRGRFLVDREQLCAEVLPALERFEALRALGLPLAARLRVDSRQVAASPSLLHGEMGALVHLFDGRRTLRAALRECRFPETVAYEAATRLYMQGVLVPACVLEERERTGAR